MSCIGLSRRMTEIAVDLEGHRFQILERQKPRFSRRFEALSFCVISCAIILWSISPSYSSSAGCDLTIFSVRCEWLAAQRTPTCNASGTASAMILGQNAISRVRVHPAELASNSPAAPVHYV